MKVETKYGDIDVDELLQIFIDKVLVGSVAYAQQCADKKKTENRDFAGVSACILSGAPIVLNDLGISEKDQDYILEKLGKIIKPQKDDLIRSVIHKYVASAYAQFDIQISEACGQEENTSDANNNTTEEGESK